MELLSSLHTKLQCASTNLEKLNQRLEEQLVNIHRKDEEELLRQAEIEDLQRSIPLDSSTLEDTTNELVSHKLKTMFLQKKLEEKQDILSQMPAYIAKHCTEFLAHNAAMQSRIHQLTDRAVEEEFWEPQLKHFDKLIEEKKCAVRLQRKNFREDQTRLDQELSVQLEGATACREYVQACLAETRASIARERLESSANYNHKYNHSAQQYDHNHHAAAATPSTTTTTDLPVSSPARDIIGYGSGNNNNNNEYNTNGYNQSREKSTCNSSYNNSNYNNSSSSRGGHNLAPRKANSSSNSYGSNVFDHSAAMRPRSISSSSSSHVNTDTAVLYPSSSSSCPSPSPSSSSSFSSPSSFSYRDGPQHLQLQQQQQQQQQHQPLSQAQPYPPPAQVQVRQQQQGFIEHTIMTTQTVVEEVTTMYSANNKDNHDNGNDNGNGSDTNGSTHAPPPSTAAAADDIISAFNSTEPFGYDGTIGGNMPWFQEHKRRKGTQQPQSQPPVTDRAHSSLNSRSIYQMIYEEPFDQEREQDRHHHQQHQSGTAGNEIRSSDGSSSARDAHKFAASHCNTNNTGYISCSSNSSSSSNNKNDDDHVDDNRDEDSTGTVLPTISEIDAAIAAISALNSPATSRNSHYNNGAASAFSATFTTTAVNAAVNTAVNTAGAGAGANVTISRIDNRDYYTVDGNESDAAYYDTDTDTDIAAENGQKSGVQVQVQVQGRNTADTDTDTTTTTACNSLTLTVEEVGEGDEGDTLLLPSNRHSNSNGNSDRTGTGVLPLVQPTNSFPVRFASSLAPAGTGTATNCTNAINTITTGGAIRKHNYKSSNSGHKQTILQQSKFLTGRQLAEEQQQQQWEIFQF